MGDAIKIVSKNLAAKKIQPSRLPIVPLYLKLKKNHIRRTARNKLRAS